MSKTMHDICARAQRVGLEPDQWLRMEEIDRRERSEAEMYECRWGHDNVPGCLPLGAGIPMRGAVDLWTFCPYCGRNIRRGK